MKKFLLLLLLCGCKVSPPNPAAINKGDFVVIRLTGETGQVIRAWSNGAEVRTKDYNIKGFASFELTKIKYQD